MRRKRLDFLCYCGLRSRPAGFMVKSVFVAFYSIDCNQDLSHQENIRMAGFELEESGPRFKLRIRLSSQTEKGAEANKKRRRTQKKNKVEPYQRKTSQERRTNNEKIASQKKKRQQLGKQRKKSTIRFPPIVIKRWSF